MAVITKDEIKGNPPREDEPAKAGPKPTTTQAADVRDPAKGAISAHAARELGENAVTEGALARAERHVAAGRGIFPQAGEQPKRITVDREGKVIPESQATEGATVLVGAEAEAYEKAHPAKEAEKAADKSRKAKPRTKAKKARR